MRSASVVMVAPGCHPDTVGAVTGPFAEGARGDVPRLVPPMLPATSSADPPTGPDWRIEVAWTGHRCIAYVHPDGRVRLLSGAANSMTAAYPELAGPLRERLPRWHGTVPPGEAAGDRWARPPAPSAAPTPAPAVPAPRTAEPAPEPAPAPAEAVEQRRLEQHFVYNSLNTVASLIRTDPGRARELLIGFADLSRAADGPPTTTLGRELEAVRAYLELERARFGARLEVAVQVDDGLGGVAVEALAVLGLVRAAVQQDIEPRREGGLLALTARRTAGGCEVVVSTTAGAPVRLLLRG
jgi:hypothetical protein